MADDAGLFERLSKRVKRKKIEKKAARNKRQRQRAKRRRSLRQKKEAAEEFASDVRELAGATRPAGAVRGAIRTGERAAEAGARGAAAADRGLEALDESLGGLEGEPDFFGGGERQFLTPEDLQKAEERAEREVRDSLIKQRKEQEKDRLRRQIEVNEENPGTGPDFGLTIFGDGEDDTGDGQDEFEFGPPRDLV